VCPQAGSNRWCAIGFFGKRSHAKRGFFGIAQPNQGGCSAMLGGFTTF
jgi:hypothetical protein